MKYNKSYDGGDFSDYLEYLKTIDLPKKLFDFASDPKRHDFSDESLHDSWLTSVNIGRDDFGNINISITLRAQKGKFRLLFRDVEYYRIAQATGDMYADLITFEIGKEDGKYEKDLIYFNAEFALESGNINVLSKYMEIKEELD